VFIYYFYDFESEKEYNDYLELLEFYVNNLVNKYDLVKTKAHIDRFKEKNAQRLDFRKVFLSVSNLFSFLFDRNKERSLFEKKQKVILSIWNVYVCRAYSTRIE
jgi:hypothetical protein